MTATPPASPLRQPAVGLLITFEGGDGVGKTTQLDLLSTTLAAARISYRRTLEPGGTPLGQEVRRLLLHGGEVTPRAEALLYAADRAHHVDTVIRPALEDGAVVVCDRYLDSSVAYQGAARSLGPTEVRDLSLWATGGLLPDLTVLLDADPALARQRTAVRGATDRLEREPGAFHHALREQFLALAAAEPTRFTVIDACQPVAQVRQAVNQVVGGLLAAHQGRVRREDGSREGAATAFSEAVRRLQDAAAEDRERP